MIVVSGLPLKDATMMRGLMGSMLIKDLHAIGLANIPTPPIDALIAFFVADPVKSFHSISI